jgi:histone H3/H4
MSAEIEVPILEDKFEQTEVEQQTMVDQTEETEQAVSVEERKVPAKRPRPEDSVPPNTVQKKKTVAPPKTKTVAPPKTKTVVVPVAKPKTTVIAKPKTTVATPNVSKKTMNKSVAISLPIVQEQTSSETQMDDVIVPPKKPHHRKAVPVSSRKKHEEGTRPHRFKPGTRALLDIRKLQKYTGTIITRTAMKSMLVKLMNEGGVVFRVNRHYLNIGHHKLEDWLIKVFQTAQIMAIHRGCQGVQEKDFKLALHYHGSPSSRELDRLPPSYVNRKVTKKPKKKVVATDLPSVQEEEEEAAEQNTSEAADPDPEPNVNQEVEIEQEMNVEPEIELELEGEAVSV